MPLEINWILIQGDNRSSDAPLRRPPDGDYLRQLGGAIDYLGFDGALVLGPSPWTYASYLAAHTEQMKFIIPQHPGDHAPLTVAEHTVTLDHLSRGRVIVNAVSGADPWGPPRGIFADKAGRYAMADEYWEIWKRLLDGESVDFDGRYFQLKGAQLHTEPYAGRPPLHFGGSSEPAFAVAAKHVDVYLSYGEPPSLAAEKFAKVQALAAAQGRRLRLGIYISVLVRESREEAWAEIQRQYERLQKPVLDGSRQRDVTRGAEGFDRLYALAAEKLRGGEFPRSARELEIYPDIWGGYSLFNAGVTTVIVGDPETVAARLEEYIALGVEVFILRGTPMLEEAYSFGRLVLPLLRRKYPAL